jgi:hypothetical protein
MITEDLLNEIHQLNATEHVVIGTILRKYPNIKLNENNQGIMINVTTISDEAVQEILQYIKYVKEQQEVVNLFEDEVKKYKEIIEQN